jgi:hypothetical protein
MWRCAVDAVAASSRHDTVLAAAANIAAGDVLSDNQVVLSHGSGDVPSLPPAATVAVNAELRRRDGDSAVVVTAAALAALVSWMYTDSLPNDVTTSAALAASVTDAAAALECDDFMLQSAPR